MQGVLPFSCSCHAVMPACLPALPNSLLCQPSVAPHALSPVVASAAPAGARCSVYCATSPDLEKQKLQGKYYFDSNCTPIAPSRCGLSVLGQQAPYTTAQYFKP